MPLPRLRSAFIDAESEDTWRSAPEPATAEHFAAGASAGDPQFFQVPGTGTAPNGLPYLSWDQAAAQWDRAGASWTGVFGDPVTVTYAFRATGTPPAGAGVSVFQQYNALQIQVVEEALRFWSEVTNITFVRVGSGTTGPGAYSNNATMLFGNFMNGPDQFTAFAYLPDPTGTAADRAEGDVWSNGSRLTMQNPVGLPVGARILMHEIGHTLGILHPSDYNGGAGSGLTYEVDAQFFQDSHQFSAMSYFPENSTGAYFGGAVSIMPMMFDIAAAQLLYGVNNTTRTGDTTYGFNANAGHDAYLIQSALARPVFCIWDAGGVDALDLSGFTSNSNIDLRQESFSSAGVDGSGFALVANISIARGAVIENAIGGAGADTILGNSSANVLNGNGGADSLSGDAGADVLIGGGDNDVLNGGTGVDASQYVLASSGATWVRSPSGQWTVTTGAFGADTLTGVEFLDFTDRDVFLDRAASTFSGDGSSDILFRGSTGAIVSWNVLGAALQSSASLGSAAAATWTPLGVGDFNGDGRDDVVWREISGLVYGWQMNGAAIQQAVAFTGIGAEWSFLGMGDFNLDGVDDMAWRQTSGNVFTWEMNASGAIGSSGYVTGLGLDWSLAGIGDFTGDGRDDFLWRNDDGATYVWGMNGRNIVSSTPTGAQVGNDWTVLGVGDFNRDGRDDILWQDSTGLIASWQMDGATLLGASYYGTVDTGVWSVANVGDYNGDGRDDILFTGNGVVYVWLLGAGVIAGSGVIAGVGGEWGIIGD